MSLICFASQKGSPGATATAVAVAAALTVSDGRRKVLVEADVSGGTLAIRYRMPVEPGLLTLAAAVRGGLEPDGLWRHTQELPGGLSVVVCPDGADQVHAAMAASGALLGRYLDGLGDVDVICDLGRLAPDSPSLEFVAQASALLMVARPHAEQLQPAARKLISLRPYIANLGWVLVGQKPYGPSEVEATYDFPVVGLIADDPRSVSRLEQGGVSKRLRRHPFIRSTTTLAATLADWLAPVAPTPAKSSGQNTAPVYPAPPASSVPATSSLADSRVEPFEAAPSIPPPPVPDMPWPEEQTAASGEPDDDLDHGRDDDAEAFPMNLIELDWLPPTTGERSTLEPVDNPHLPSPSLGVEPADAESTEDDPDDDWDASPFTITADLHKVFERPGSSAQDRTKPPMPPPAKKIDSPQPVFEGAISSSNGVGVPSSNDAAESAIDSPSVPPMPGPEKRLGFGPLGRDSYGDPDDREGGSESGS